jgi:hypothetical protein
VVVEVPTCSADMAQTRTWPSTSWPSVVKSEPAIPGASLLVVADEPEHAPIKRRTAKTTIAFTTARMVNATP